MTAIAEHFRIPFEPVADPAAVVLAPTARFTVLTSRLLRLEYDPAGQFEDRPSQAFWYRRQPVPAFEVEREGEWLTIATEHLRLRYRAQVGGFTPDSLAVEILDRGVTWRYGDRDPGNLLGTARTLDETSGRLRLEQGLLSRSGWAVVDDSRSLVFDADSWITTRRVEHKANGSGLDLYFFGYGRAYRDCLADFRRVSGPVPLIPRWILGNWWSRYWEYSQEELTGLMQEFEERGVPLSVCIVDMDWHITRTASSTSSGWTGYTWNRELFPDPEGFIAWLHTKGLRTALNLHPAEGIHPHEAQYPDMARSVGIDPETKAPVPFDIPDPDFARAYFEILHHPMERQGVDFWWLDWQQGKMSKLAGLDPLWWLNHLHFLDLGRDGRKRPFIFSRWGGLGNHRYPIGFSGDTQVTWESLAFQPCFTATAANVCYGWWSHDIGGHFRGMEEPELYTRWVQFGVFSPITRLHSTKNPYHDRRPWGHGAEVFRITRDALQLRHALIPYIYTMAWRDHRAGVPLVTPMYHAHGDVEASYHCPNQYYFGSELIAAPHVRRRDPDTRLSRQVVWLPAGDWIDFFSGEHRAGGVWHAVYGDLDEIPVFAKGGAIVPLGPKTGWGGVGNLEVLEVHVFGGADNRFELYEDDGETTDYVRSRCCLTAFSVKWQGDRMWFRIAPAQGDRTLIPARRRYRLRFRGIRNPVRVEAVLTSADGKRSSVLADPVLAYDEARETLAFQELPVDAGDELVVTLATDSDSLLSRRNRTAETCRKLLRAFLLDTGVKGEIDRRLPQLLADIDLLGDAAMDLRESQSRALAEVIRGRALDRAVGVVECR